MLTVTETICICWVGIDELLGSFGVATGSFSKKRQADNVLDNQDGGKEELYQQPAISTGICSR